MKWETEVVSPASYISSTNWLIEETKTTKWTPAENKIFENALAVYDKETPDRWQKVASMIPGKTVVDVIKQYKELEADVSSIEAGLYPVPGYDSDSPFTLDLVSSNNGGYYDGFKHPYGKRSSSVRPVEQERKKGVPWTEEEHKLFLLGLKKHGKGDWRNISRNFVITRTPTQVASHAQKYFIRQLSGGKDKRRASIHDITTVNLDEATTSPSSDNQSHHSPDKSTLIPQQAHLQWNYFHHHQPNAVAETMAFDSTQGGGNMLMSSPYGLNSFGFKLQPQNFLGHHSLAFQQQYPRG